MLLKTLFNRVNPVKGFVYETDRLIEDVEALLATLAANTELAQNALRLAVARLSGAERDCECGSALATALITRKDLVPQDVKDRLAPIVQKYLD